MTLFDAYLMVDWSASSRPNSGEDSIWIGVAVRDSGQVRLDKPENPRTRAAAELRVKQQLVEFVAQGCRVLVGFDFPYGYPSGFASALRLTSDLPPWRATWNRLRESIRDDERNESNRFEVASDLNAKLAAIPGPFWGCPPNRQTETLRSTGCSYPYDTLTGGLLHRKRHAERRLPRVQETWRLYGNGSVGSQALVGIPRVTALRGDAELAAHSRVWPFETGFTDRPTPQHGPFVLHAEIWPGVVTIDPTRHAVRDAAQVLTLAHHFAQLDEKGTLATLFDVPRDLSESDVDTCVAEEGWILGA